jgi:hypothetical protein
LHLMPDEVNNPPCPVHGAFPRALHEEGFQGAVEVLEELLATVSGVGTTSYTRCPYGYEASWNGIVRALEDLNATISGIQGGGVGASGLAPGSGIYFAPSGTYTTINADAQRIPGAIVSGVAPSGAYEGTIWFDENEGRTFVYVSGASNPGWYQLNAEALAYTSETPPSGVGNNAPPRDGLLWFNRDLGNILVYDAVSSGWYEPDARRAVAYRETPPTAVVEGEVWYDQTTSIIKIWDGSNWTSLLDPPTPTKTTRTTDLVVLDSYLTSYVGPKTYSIAVQRGNEVQNSDITLIHDANDAYVSQHSVVFSSGILAAFSGQLVDGAVELVGYSNSIDRTVFRPIVWNGTTVSSSYSTAFTGKVLDSYPVSFSGTKTYSINVARGGDVQNSDVTLVHTSVSGFSSEHSVVYSSGALATFSGQVAGGNVQVVAYPTSTAYTTFRPVIWGNTEGLPLTTASTVGTLIDRYPVQASGTKTITVNVNRGGEVQSSDLTVVHTPSDAYLSQHSVVFSSGILAAFSGAVVGDFVEIVAYSNTAASTVFRPVRVTP